MCRESRGPDLDAAKDGAANRTAVTGRPATGASRQGRSALYCDDVCASLSGSSRGIGARRERMRRCQVDAGRRQFGSPLLLTII